MSLIPIKINHADHTGHIQNYYILQFAATSDWNPIFFVQYSPSCFPHHLTNDPLLAAIFGGIAVGFGVDIESTLDSLISILVTSKTYDMVLHHMDKVSLIITTNLGEMVADDFRKKVATPRS